MNDVYLLLGSNIGDRFKALQKASILISDTIGEIVNKSGIYLTEPWGFDHPQDFYNHVLHIRTKSSPRNVLAFCLEIEKKMGRIRKKDHFEARYIDIDLLLYNSEIIKNEEITIPHPRLHLRRFTLEPLCEIAPNVIHPVLKKSMTELLAACTDTCRVEKIDPSITN